MTEVTLGRFGDRRLEKGGPSCMPAWCRQVGAASGFDVSAVIGPERFA